GSIKPSRDGPSHAASLVRSSGGARATTGLCHRVTFQREANMISSLRRFGITVAFLGFAATQPATVGAQPPVYLTQWGTYGSGDGQFGFFAPSAVATDAAGNVYVVDAYNYRIQKFTGTGTYLTQCGSLG